MSLYIACIVVGLLLGNLFWDKITGGFIRCELNIDKADETDVVKVSFDNSRIKNKPRKESPSIFYIPYLGHSEFLGRTIFMLRKTNEEYEDEITYDYNGYSVIDNSELEKVFFEIMNYHNDNDDEKRQEF